MTKLHILGVPALVLLLLAPDAMAQRRGGGAISGGVRGAMVGELVGGSEGAQTGARVGAVAGATRAAVDREAQRRADYQTTAAYQNAPRSNFNTASPAVLGTIPPDAATVPGGEAVIRKDDKPVFGITYPSDWKEIIGDRYVSAVSADGQAYSMIATIEGAADKPTGLAKVKEGLERYLQDIKYDEPRETKRGALLVTGTGTGKKAGVPVVFAAGVFDTGAGQFAGAAFVVDAGIEDHYKETVRQICQTIRVADQFEEKK
jgi:uncharacterized protein YcfJ